MRISFENDFYDGILSRGYDYYLADKVNNVNIKENIVTATVKGSSDYNVMLEVCNNLFIDGECDCPYYEDGKYCKHMAAVLYYLSEKSGLSNNGEFNLKDIVNKIDDKQIRCFLYDNLVNNSDLLNKFRVEFNNYFPKLSKEQYENKIYNAIYNCADRHGFIDYKNAYNYEHAMFEYIHEAEKLIDDKDYNNAFLLSTIILDSIPKTEIDDSNGSTGMVANSCIEIIHSIMDEISNKDKLLMDILDYVINEVKTLYLYNYGIDLNHILNFFIDNNLYLEKIESSLEIALDISKDKEYFYGRKDYIDYLIQIYNLKKEFNKVFELLKKYSYDENVCIKYVDELLESSKINDAINVLKSNLSDDNYKSRKYAEKLKQIYFENNMTEEYKNILYDIFYKYSRYDFATYLEIKKLYSSNEWNEEKNKIINTLKSDNYNDRVLNDVYIEEKMYDELFLNVCNRPIDYIEKYEEYLLPKYSNELLNIYKKLCLYAADRANNRKLYRDVAISVNHIIKMDNSGDIVKSILNEISEKHFRNRPAMLDEFKCIIQNLDKYINEKI